jgi:hypothetical protein
MRKGKVKALSIILHASHSHAAKMQVVPQYFGPVSIKVGSPEERETDFARTLVSRFKPPRW